MKNIIKFITICFVFSTYGCGADFFDSVIEVKTEPAKPLLVVNAFWEAGNDSLAVFVSKSRDSKDNSFFNVRDRGNLDYFSGYDSVANSKVELFRNDQLLGEIPKFKGGYHVSKGRFKLDTASGVRYKIRVSAPNFPTVEATQVIQSKPKITQTIFRKDGALYQNPSDPFGQPQKGDDFSIEIADNGTEVNSYFLVNRGFDWYSRTGSNSTRSYDIYTQNLDPLAEDLFLNDKSFNGETHRWRLFARVSTFDGQNAIIPKKGDYFVYFVQTFNKDWFLFNKTRDLLRDAEDNPFFTEPVILHSNIKGGYGLFTIYSEQRVLYFLP